MSLKNLRVNTTAKITQSSTRCREMGLMPGKTVLKLFDDVILVDNIRYAIGDVDVQCEN